MFGWQRATLLGAFFNGVFLFALGLSVFMQAIERFTNATCKSAAAESRPCLSDGHGTAAVENPQVVLIVGCVDLSFNILLMSFLHGESEDSGHEAKLLIKNTTMIRNIVTGTIRTVTKDR